ncbi:SseB family protein [uncultured Acetatifactor sp.]|uniref:SseB family protein n=1 Tax=uncultured Acetatifactor sp. TaxID=1671927 RepID=UPI002634E5A9|nr:SseB family protein [uncultured Acetatifactor sp.]
MEFNKPVSNPLLMGSIELMKAEDTPAHRNMFMGELAKAEFLSPAIIEPAPQEADGKLAIAPGSKVQFPMINSPDGAKFFMAFTDAAEYGKWKEKNKELPTFAMKIEEFAAMILRRDPKGGLCPALGMVINPMGANILVPREMLAGMMSARAAQMQRMAEKQKK